MRPVTVLDLARVAALLGVSPGALLRAIQDDRRVDPDALRDPEQG